MTAVYGPPFPIEGLLPCRYLPGDMTRGSLSLPNYPSNRITIRCVRCDRLGRYRRETLRSRYGDEIAMPDLLNILTACPNNAGLSTDRCKAHYVELAPDKG
uniref:Uncharacterized protein n=1 Tax=uncultured marine microorganism HF4000_APKG8L7 TaxID=455556 RepID=B3TB69_9ZZZZ|nr:hypothetical protein ALOHA_HF4000APKG8L7ctg1g3 [uncultured marine microorganism HF4000_APKG8L7]